ncbi:MAG: highly acidic protein [Pseudomonadota bacterium]
MSERYPAIAAYREALQYDYEPYEAPERYEREYDVDDSDYAYDDYDNDYDYDLSR